MSSSGTRVSRRRPLGPHAAEERRVFVRFAFVWIASLIFLALAWYDKAPPL